MTTIATNKKAYHNYFLQEKWECGIALNGGEVKSIRAGGASFADAFAHIDKGELFLYNLHINPYEQASYLNEEPSRPRKLLVHAKEIERINGHLTRKGLTLIPTKMYFNKRGWVKVEVAVGQGKKLYDKREDIKTRDINREIARSVKRSK
jgi:SsrA-binding protein